MSTVILQCPSLYKVIVVSACLSVTEGERKCFDPAIQVAISLALEHQKLEPQNKAISVSASLGYRHEYQLLGWTVQNQATNWDLDSVACSYSLILEKLLSQVALGSSKSRRNQCPTVIQTMSVAKTSLAVANCSQCQQQQPLSFSYILMVSSTVIFVYLMLFVQVSLPLACFQ